MSDSWSEVLKKLFIQDGPLLIIINGALGPRNKWPKIMGNWGEISPLYALRIQICPKKRISPIILFWGWDRDHQSYSREGSGFLETWNCGPLLITGRGAHLVGYPAPREPFLGAAVEEVGSAEWVKCRLKLSDRNGWWFCFQCRQATFNFKRNILSSMGTQNLHF